MIQTIMIVAQGVDVKNQAIAARLLDRQVAGVNLRPGALRDQLGDQPTLLVFLRHFG